MNAIFDLIFSNFLFFMFFVAVIFNLFRKLSKTVQQQQKQEQQEQQGRRSTVPEVQRQQQQSAQRPQQQRRQQHEQERFDWRDLVKQLETSLTGQQQQEKKEVQQAKPQVAEQMKDQTDLIEEYRIPPIENKIVANQLQVEHNDKRKRISLELDHISSKEAVKGVVWAEILGPPRGKRSHYRR